MASGDQSCVVPVTRSSAPSSFQDFHYSQIRGRNNSGSDGNNDSLSHKLACAAATFRAKDKRFSGSYDSLLRLDRIMQLLRITIEQYQVLETSTVSLMANGLDVVAHDYYLERTKGQFNTLSEAFYLLYGLFDSYNKRRQSQAYLKALSLASVLEDESSSKSHWSSLNERSRTCPLYAAPRIGTKALNIDG